MSTFARQNGAWVESSMMGRDDSSWTDPTSNAFARVGSDWVQFQPGVLDTAFPPPIDLVATPTSTAMTLTWTNVVLGAEPTHVQFRVPEVTDVWTEYSHPTTTASVAALASATDHNAQLRYVIRSTDTGEITRTSAVATVFFTTAAADTPSFPAPDPGGSGPDSTVTFPPTAGTPGGVGGSDCWWEYIVQTPDIAVLELLTWVDTAVTAEVAGDVGSIDIDFVDEGLNCGGLARWKFREVCDSVPGDWEFSEAFMLPCDWADPCGGQPDTDVFDGAPWTDAIMALFTMCVDEDNGQFIEDAVGGGEFGKLEGYLGPFHDGTHWRLLSKSDAVIPLEGAALTAGKNTDVGALTTGDDLSLTIGVNCSDLPNTAFLGGTRILVVGDKITIRLIGSGSTFTALAYIPTASGSITLTGSIAMALDTDYQITVTLDADGSKKLYVNGVLDVNSLDTTNPDFTGVTDDVAVYATSESRTFYVGAWDRELTIDEIGELVVAPRAATTSGLGSTSATGEPLTVTVGDVVFVTTVERSGGGAAIVHDIPTGTATLGTRTEVVSFQRFDTLGVSDGRADVVAYEVTASGTVLVTGGTGTGQCRSVLKVSGLDVSGSVSDAWGTVTKGTIAQNNASCSVTPGSASGTGDQQLIVYTGGGDTPITPTIGDGAIVFSTPLTGQIINSAINDTPDTYSAHAIMALQDGYSTSTQSITLALTGNPASMSSGGHQLFSIELIEA